MLTSYDTLTAGIFEQAGVRALLVGDTSAEMVFGYPDTVPVTMDEMVPMVQAVVRGTRTALVVADLPFGSYQAGPAVALANAVRHLKEGGAQAVKLEGGRRVLPQVETMVGAGIPVMGHLGLTPQSVNVLGGVRRVQGRGDAGDELLADALALESAGAFAVVLESVPAALGRRVSEALRIPTVGIGAGPDCDAQILVWQDMAASPPAGSRGSSSTTPTPGPGCSTRPAVTPPTLPPGATRTRPTVMPNAAGGHGR